MVSFIGALPPSPSPGEFDFPLDLYGNAKRKFCNTDGAPCVRSPFRPEDADDEVGEPVDHGRQSNETGRGIDHSEHPGPARDPIQAPELTLQAPENGKAGELRGRVGLFFRDVSADLSERLRQASIGVRGAVA